MAAQSNLKNMVMVLGLTCLLCSAILGGAYALTKEPIDAAAVAKTNKAIGAVLPAFDETIYESVDVDGKTYNYYKAERGGETVGYAVESTVVGFGGPLSLMVGVTPDGVVHNTSVLSHAETPGLGAKITQEAFLKSCEGQKLYDKKGDFVSVRVLKSGTSSEIAEENRVDAISGATITSRGVDEMMREITPIVKNVPLQPDNKE